jgi:antitoxin component of RelBE/YafQ-DinJ toxin-antitoxin module
MSRTVLQIPMTADLRKSAEAAAAAQGFSSLQEMVRVFLNRLSNQAISISFTKDQPAVQLSAKANRRYSKMIDDIEKGKNVYKAKDVDDFIRQLEA